MDRVCPLLGLATDRRTVVDGVDAAHRCHAETPPLPLERQEQAQLCLTATYERCERYQGHLARAGRSGAGRLAVGDGFTTTRMLVAPEPAWRGFAGRARRARRGPLVAAAAATLAIGVGGVALAAAVVDGRVSFAALMPEASPSGSPAPTVVTSATPRLTSSPSATPTPSVEPSGTPTPSPTPVPTPVPTVAPTPVPATPAPPPAQQTYVVQEGDTLALIAQQFGTTVEALSAANGIEDPNEIVIGDVLVIP